MAALKSSVALSKISSFSDHHGFDIRTNTDLEMLIDPTRPNLTDVENESVLQKLEEISFYPYR